MFIFGNAAAVDVARLFDRIIFPRPAILAAVRLSPLQTKLDMQRRDMLRGLVGLAASCLPSQPLLAAAHARSIEFVGDARPFDYAWLQGHARHFAGTAYRTIAAKSPSEERN